MDITKIQHSGSEWKDMENNRIYRSIGAGGVWPDRGIPGFIVVVGESGQSPRESRTYFTLYEVKFSTISAMVEKMMELSCIVDGFVAPPSQAVRREVLSLTRNIVTWDKTNEKIRRPWGVTDGDPTELFEYADQGFNERTAEGNKSVFLGACQQVRSGLEQLPRPWESVEVFLKLPEVAALYYILGQMFRLANRG